MKTTILITEEQQRKLIIESVNNEIEDNVRKNYNLFKRISEFSSDEFSNNLGFLITWGAGIGGLMGPVNDFLEGNYPDLSTKEIYLILLSIISTLFLDKKSFVSELLLRIKEKGLTSVFKSGLKKTKELKNTFVSFLKTLNVTTGNMISMLSYAFLIPSLGPIIKLIESGNVTYDDVKLFVTSLGASKLVTISGKTLGELLKKLISKIQG